MRPVDDKERRRYPRLQGAAVEYITLTKKILKETSFTENISAVGIRILASERIKKDTVLHLKIYLPRHSQPIQATGRVVWVNASGFLKRKELRRKHYDVGVKFIEISEEDRSEIYKHAVDETTEDPPLRGPLCEKPL